MKTLTITTVLCAVISICSAQKLKKIELSDLKVTNIYLEEDVIDVEVGFPDDFDYNWNGKIVKVTCLEAFDYETNLTITTNNGLYGFDVIYVNDPPTIYHKVKANEKVITFDKPIELVSNGSKVEDEKDITNSIVSEILDYKDDKFLSYKEKQKVYFVFNSAYIQDDKLYFYFSIDNRSLIDYDLDYISVKNKSTKNSAKRTAREQYDVEFVHHSKFDKVKANKKKSFVLEIQKLTLEPKTKLVFGIHEMQGGRDGIFDFTEKDFKKIEIIE